MSNDISIYKQNNLIQCPYKELQNWTELHHDLLNEIISIFQINKSTETLFEELNNIIMVKRATLEKNACIKRKTNEDLFIFLKQIRDTSFTLTNFKDEFGVVYKYKTISFFNSVSLKETPGKHSYFIIEYSKEFAMLCNKGYSILFGNYAKINLSITTRLRSKYSKAVLEMLESNRYRKDFVLSDEELHNYLKYEKNPFSYLVRQIERSYKEVINHCNFTYIPNKKEKTIRFILN